jgi:hypothetical protein
MPGRVGHGTQSHRAHDEYGWILFWPGRQSKCGPSLTNESNRGAVWTAIVSDLSTCFQSSGPVRLTRSEAVLQGITGIPFKRAELASPSLRRNVRRHGSAPRGADGQGGRVEGRDRAACGTRAWVPPQSPEPAATLDGWRPRAPEHVMEPDWSQEQRAEGLQLCWLWLASLQRLHAGHVSSYPCRLVSWFALWLSCTFGRWIHAFIYTCSAPISLGFSKHSMTLCAIHIMTHDVL